MYQNFKRGHTQLNVYTHTVLFYRTYKKNCNRMKFDIMTSFDVEQYLVFVFWWLLCKTDLHKYINTILEWPLHIVLYRVQ